MDKCAYARSQQSASHGVMYAVLLGMITQSGAIWKKLSLTLLSNDTEGSVLQAFLEQGNKLISCSKDSQVRVWDLNTQHCSQTLVGYRGEVWALALDPSQSRLVTGSADIDLQVYEVLTQEAAADEAAGQRDTLKLIGGLAPNQNVHNCKWFIML